MESFRVSSQVFYICSSYVAIAQSIIENHRGNASLNLRSRILRDSEPFKGELDFRLCGAKCDEKELSVKKIG